MTDRKHRKKLEKIRKIGEQYKEQKELMDVYAPYFPPKKKKKVSNVMLVLIVIAIVGYVVAGFALQQHTGIEISPTITTCWFTFWGAEIVALAGIKMSKIKNENYTVEIDESIGSEVVYEETVE